MWGKVAGIAVAGASFAGLHAIAPWSQLYGTSFNGSARGTRVLALTYDDGPNDPYTPRLLDVLAKHGARATFFLVGQFVEARPRIARAVVEAGHAIGNHTYSHPHLIFLSPSRLRDELERATRAIEDATGITPKLFRPPFGWRLPGTFSIVREYGMTPVMWRVICFDWSARSCESIVRKAVSKIKGGDVILLHDGGHRKLGTDRSFSVQATDEILRRYKGEGYEFVTVPQMMAAG